MLQFTDTHASESRSGKNDSLFWVASGEDLCHLEHAWGGLWHANGLRYAIGAKWILSNQAATLGPTKQLLHDHSLVMDGFRMVRLSALGAICIDERGRDLGE